MEFPFGLNPYENDQGAWGASLLNAAEIVLACLDTARPGSVAEVGAYAGDLTRLLLRWGEQAGARVIAIDPAPHPKLEQLERDHPNLELIREQSLTALARIEAPGAVILDGDHNYFTVTEELGLVGSAEPFPLVLLHDVCWPHGRRDDYFNPQQIPPQARQPIAPKGKLYPGEPGVLPRGLPYQWPAAREGGPRNGVLSALEDFAAAHDRLTFAIVPAFFGVGVLWPKDAQYAPALQRIVEPWDRNQLLERLERNRVLHLASSQVQLQSATEARERLARTDQLLETMLHSRAFAAAELFLRVRQLGKPAFSRAQIRRLLG